MNSDIQESTEALHNILTTTKTIDSHTEDSLQQNQFSLDLPTVSVETQQAQQITATRRSDREKHPPIWMKDFVSLNVHHDATYPISNYMYYENISSKYKVYISTFSSTTEPNSYAETLRDPKYVDAMKSEIEALESNHTWEVVSLPE
ncbi:uncharacterized protein [Nicotiana tomentosiformis]|uniref:uncharacterized protein n=1 Tax=Nicotiana tomentosiformis TaxID=4098 RepID=UPI00388C8856